MGNIVIGFAAMITIASAILPRGDLRDPWARPVTPAVAIEQADLPADFGRWDALAQDQYLEVRTLLAKFGLGADHAERSVDELSPGERTRAGMALLQAVGTNVLVLDEPTNHLDLPAIEQLEAALDSYDGALLLVTHDRRMLENVRLDRRWLVRDGQVSEL